MVHMYYSERIDQPQIIYDNVKNKIKQQNENEKTKTTDEKKKIAYR